MNKNSNFVISGSSTRGFSLVELSIVLVIIGIIVGVVTAGVTIQKTSELRSIITQVEQFKVGIEAFDDKFEDLPGDMADAFDYWGADCDATNTNCNGDGNGIVAIGSGSDSESFRAWQHLSLAGMIDGEYTGTGTGTAHIPFENVPGTSRTGGAYHIRTHTNDTQTVAGTNVSVGGFLASNWPAEKFLTPSEAFYIDNKMDDGDPDSGKSQSRNYFSGGSWQTGCISGTDPNRTYLKTGDDKFCIMFFDIR